MRTTSTSAMTGAGLKKCRPTTSAGRWVAIAHSITGRLDVVVASTTPGLQISSSAAKSAFLTPAPRPPPRPPGRRRRGRRAMRPGDPGQGGVAVGLGQLAAHDGLVQRRRDRLGSRADLLRAAGDRDDLVAGLGEHLDDAGGHRAGADHADLRDRARAVGGVGRPVRRCLLVGDDHRRARASRTCRSPRPVLRPSRPAVTICLISGTGACRRSRPPRRYIVSRISYAVSRPIRSISASGPIGRPQPSRIAASMSSRVA